VSDLATEQEPYIRLLQCRTCKSIDELPPYDGPEGGDVLLQITAERHGETHTGVLYNVPLIMWQSEKMKPKILDQITNGASGLDVFGTGFYATRMQFHDDAMKCYGQHQRPKGQCPEFRSEKKRLLPDTKADRKEVGLSDPKNAPGPKVYLCQFCPVAIFNARKQTERIE
jgi:hypothetical protein